MRATPQKTLSPAAQGAPRTRGRLAWLLPVLLLTTLAAYRPAWHGSPVWDDDAHITRSELQTTDGLRRIWFEVGATQQYYPLAHSAFWLQHRLWGDDPLGYHAVNIVLHALSAFLLALILRRLAVPWPWFAAMLFALHPVHVESVAWITELKNCLSGALYLAAALAYLEFDTRRRKTFYLLAAVLFALALLSKTVTATLPAAILVVLWWRRGTLDWRRDVVPVLPLFAIGVAGGLFTTWAERTLIGARGAAFALSAVDRCLIAGRAVWFYLGTLTWPAHLAFIYPRWQVSARAWWQYLFPLAALLLVLAAWALRKRSRAPLAAVLLFCGTLFPAIGFLNVFPFRYSFVADHFQYLASLAIIVLFSASFAAMANRLRIGRRVAATAAVGVLVLLGVLTWNQSAHYVNAETLYRATLDTNPGCWMAHNNLGFLQLGTSLDEATAHFREALRLNPDYPEAHNNLGYALQLAGRAEEAAKEHEEALRLEPGYAEARNNLGSALERMGRVADAAGQYERAIRLRPAFLEARINLANALLQLGKPDDAATHYKEALRAQPDAPELHRRLAMALEKAGRLEEAIAQYQACVRLEPGSAAAHMALAGALYAAGRFDGAAAEYLETLRLAPDSAEAYNNLGAALERQGRLDDAIASYEQTVRLLPDSSAARGNLERARAARARR